MTGITPNGFVKMREPEIRARIISRMNTKLSAIAGRAVSVETAPHSISGAIIDTMAEEVAIVWEHMEAQYYAMYPHTAEGVNLDNAVAFTGVRRQSPARGRVYALIQGANGATVEAGAAIISDFDQRTFTLAADTVISQNTAGAFRIEVDTITPGAQYVITINGASSTYTAPSNVTAASILNAVNDYLLSLGLSSVVNNVGVDAVVDGRNSVSVGVSSNLVLTSVESVGLFLAEETGRFDIPADSFTRINSENPAVTGVRNLIAGTPGQSREEDGDLQVRYEDGPFRLGSGTLPAIRANLWQNVPGIVDLRIVENAGETTDADGRPAGSIEVIVRGGDDTMIREELMRVKGAGIAAYGLSFATLYDSEGEPHPIGITRPVAVYIWVSAQVILKEGETVNAATFQRMQSLLVEIGNRHKIGEDVIRQKFLGPLYELTDAIAEVNLRLFATPNINYVPNLNEYQPVNMPIGIRELAVFSIGRVQVF